MSTGLDTFDKTVQESNLWLKDVMERLNTRDRHHAYSTVRAVLHALRDRIGAESAAHLGAQLPMLLRSLFYEGWDPTGKPTKERHEAAFLAHIAKELPRASGRPARLEWRFGPRYCRSAGPNSVRSTRRTHVGVLPIGQCLNHEEDVVAKGQQRSNREKKKPKQDKKKITPPATPIGSTDQRGKLGRGPKKN